MHVRGSSQDEALRTSNDEHRAFGPTKDRVRHRIADKILKDSLPVTAHHDEFKVRGAVRDHLARTALHELPGRAHPHGGRGALCPIEQNPTVRAEGDQGASAMVTTPSRREVSVSMT